jgi:hypothetical protein
MPNPLCEKCKPVEVSNMDDAVGSKSCVPAYELFDTCMKANHGNVSSCGAELNAFKICFQDNKNKTANS